ncbi:uncharacterized protein LOC114361165 [Ostrinia furnacalis]|uniref:uncharacterized protein LOC114361165 n=1 Tax=Ostrinia furnacalis TaxID=93504 RepID=UPI00103E6E18|nr:uncharacterized protein LOC114361165 [Ostrinia furnacalis]
MYLLLYFCIILFVPHLSGKNVLTSLETNNNISNSKNSTESILIDFNNSNVTLNTEGGSIKPELPLISLPKEVHSDLSNLDKEIVNSKGKSIVPRKGVQYESAEDTLFKLNHSERIDSTVSDPKFSNNTVIAASLQPPSSKPSTLLSSSSVGSAKDSTLNKTQSTVSPKKPAVLSAEALSETDRRVQIEKAKTESSSKSIVSDQLPSPSVKHEPATHSRHPDLVMPIVITMLVVPMFAVLGYMALRRGQEAWKNRHYKRMDFLLDGMYND